MTGFLSTPFLPNVRRKVFVSYHHAGDQSYYDFLATYCGQYLELFSDRSLGEPVRSRDPEYVNRAIREDYIVGSSVTIVLCGYDTSGRKYVDWEIRSTLHHRHGLLGVILPTIRRDQLGRAIIPDRLNANKYYAHFIDWTYDHEAWKQGIATAYDRSQNLAWIIDNSLPKMTRNA